MLFPKAILQVEFEANREALRLHTRGERYDPVGCRSGSARLPTTHNAALRPYDRAPTRAPVTSPPGLRVPLRIRSRPSLATNGTPLEDRGRRE
jgi:hypothetical protein